MDMISVSQSIENKILELERLRSKLKTYAQEKAKSYAEYEKKLAITIIRLKNGEIVDIEGNTVENPPATISEKIARGYCWQEALNRDKAEAEYKALITTVQAIQAEMNGYQSIFRHLEERTT